MQEQMRIAIIYLGRRGSGGRISFEIARQLNEKSQLLAVVSQHAESRRLWESVPCERLEVDTYQNLPGAVTSWIARSKIRQLAGHIRGFKPDVLLFPMFYTWNPFLQRYLRDIPTVVAVHDPVPHPGLVDFFYRQMEDRSIRMAERCIYFSQSLKQALQQRKGSAEKLDHIPLGALVFRKQDDTRVSQTPPRESVLLFFGRITRYKGLEDLLRAYRKIIENHRVRLVIAGEGDLRPYRELIKGLPDVDVVNRWINEDEAGTYFEQASMVVLPYTSASQSGVLTVAAGFGLPVIATRTGGLSEQIQDTVTGLLVEPGSVDQLVAAIEKLLDDPEWARQLGYSLRRDYAENRSWETISNRVHASLERAVNEYGK